MKKRRSKHRPREPQPRNVLLAMEFYIHAVHEGVVRYAKQAGWILDASMVHTRRVPEDWEGDGIICELNSIEMGQSLQRFNRPMVGVVAQPRGSLKCPLVLMDDVMCGRMAAEHFIERGFRRLAYFQPSSSPVVDARGEGFRAAVEEAKCEYYPLNWSQFGQFQQMQDRKRWLSGMLQKLPRPLGVFASGDLFATEVLSACRMADVGVPEEVAVLGVDNDSLYVEVAPVPLSSVDNNLETVGFEAAAMLDRVMKGHKPPPKPVVIPPVGVVTRRSTDILAVDDLEVGRALAYIFAHFREPIRVSGIAEATGVSLRQLQTQFRRVVGRTIVEQVTRLRLEQAMKYLNYTDGNVEEIAKRCGFTSGKYMGKLFVQNTGMSPREFRKQQEELSKTAGNG